MNCVTRETVLLFLLAVTCCKGCPHTCVCKWRSGKQTVECIKKDLLVIPLGIETDTQVLDVSQNNLRVLESEKFLRMNLTNLQRIYLSRCSITVVHEAAFKGLTNLVELDVSNNLLETIPTGSFLSCPSLMRLTLSGNPIRHLPKLAFNHLSYLTTLELADCQISVVNEAAFVGLYSLEWLHLSGNKLTTFPAGKRFPNSLKGVTLQDNPWHCDCHIRDFYDWLIKEQVPMIVEPVCILPKKFSGEFIRGVAKGDLACVPEVSPTSFYFEVEEGRNISLYCEINSIPSSRVSWWFEGQLIQNNTRVGPDFHVVYYIEKGEEEKHSELFIYNTDGQDNGTFHCVADNSAGTSSANFTLRILLKRVEVAEVVETYPLEYLPIALGTGSVLLIFLVIVLVVCATKCIKVRKNRLKCTSDEFPEKSNMKPTVKGEADFESVKADQEINALRCHQVQEQNPDIINGVKETRLRDRVRSGGTYNLCLLDSRLCANATVNREEYFPKMYRTLPHRRYQPSLMPLHTRRYLCDDYPITTSTTLFACSSTDKSYFDNFAIDVRYTAEGYPVKPVSQSDTTPGGEEHSASQVELLDSFNEVGSSEIASEETRFVTVHPQTVCSQVCAESDKNDVEL